ncbi:tyrosine-type recombinase/integrase [Micromonospora aurantiaca (nom. illeg.)]|uniref:tyrosine-type recombinase/integrase n=1 Tax=Micromonospora aurantiaca (nom. illeg.) TaxID=47850 RepID=UPI0033F05A7C
MPDALWDGLFAEMSCNRDRAAVELAVTTGARAAELLGMRGADIDWGDQLVRVIRKGTRAQQWLPTSPDAFTWLRLYFNDLGGIIGPNDPVWQTVNLRNGVHAPLTYDALRAVFRRVNARLGTNWTMHDLRHTCAIRLLRDERLTLRDVQTILGHANLSSTQIYLEQLDEELFARIRDHFARRSADQALPPAPMASGYDTADLAVLLGGLR